LKYEVLIAYSDYEAAQRAGQPLFARKLPVTMAILTALALGYMRLTARPIDSYTLLGVGLVWCAMIYMNRVSLPRSWRREFEQSQRQSYTIELTEETLRLTSEFEKAAWPWSSFSGWREANKCFLLYYNQGLSHIIIPKHVLDTPEDIAKVKGMLQRSLGRPMY
jgi:hypothetical protein